MPIRIRLAVVFAVATAVVFAVGSLIYLEVLTRELHATIDAELGVQAQAVRTSLAEPGHSVTAALATTPLRRNDLGQVFAPDGRLLASSPTSGKDALVGSGSLAAARRGTIYVDPTVSVPASGRSREHVRFLLSPIPVAGGTGVLAVGTSLDATDEAIDRVSDAASWVGPVIVVLAGLAAWLLSAAALRPVERMRRQASAMSADESTAGIAVPPTRDEIAALARTMNDLLARLHDAIARERAFVADAGHELRTPLAILQAELELAARPGRSLEELRTAVADAADESQRISRLADDLLVLARDTGAGSALRREPTTVADLLDASVSHAEPAAARAGVAIRVDASRDLVADIDPGRVRRLVDNLVDNAVRHTSAGGSVTVVAAADADRLRISVDDSGAGFPGEFLPHAFERFRRADAARTRDTGGTGLGLAIVQSIAVAHGGSAVAANRPSGGAEVVVELGNAVLDDHAEAE